MEKNITSKDGGEITMGLTSGDKIKIIFPQNSLEKDVSLTFAPLSNAPINGFSLEEKGAKAGPALKSPALLMFTINQTLSKDYSIIRYHEADSGYDVIPTQLNTQDNKTVLLAELSHFSQYGVKKISAAELKNIPSEQSDYNWVIYIKDTSSLSSGPIKMNITIDSKATNSSGDIIGKYSGIASAKTVNVNSSYGATASSDSNGTLNFTIGSYLVPLTSPSSNLASLTQPGDEPDFTGQGTISMYTAAAKITVPNVSANKDLSQQYTYPISLTITGPLVRMQLNTPQGAIYFDGYIRGEGK